VQVAMMAIQIKVKHKGDSERTNRLIIYYHCAKGSRSSMSTHLAALREVAYRRHYSSASSLCSEWS
jgi:hypothetical protein